MGKGLFDRIEDELEAREKTAGLSMSDVLALPDSLARLCNWMLREQHVALAEVAHFLQQDESQARAVLNDLVERGLVREIEMHGATHYRVRLAPKRGRKLPLNLWQALEDKVEE
jgi:predicted transcriptional regulator